jgi:hypothetical protein
VTRLRLRLTIAGCFPALAARPGEPDWTGALYSQVQRACTWRSPAVFTRLRCPQSLGKGDSVIDRPPTYLMNGVLDN